MNISKYYIIVLTTSESAYSLFGKPSKAKAKLPKLSPLAPFSLLLPDDSGQSRRQMWHVRVLNFALVDVPGRSCGYTEANTVPGLVSAPAYKPRIRSSGHRGMLSDVPFFCFCNLYFAGLAYWLSCLAYLLTRLILMWVCR